MNSELKHIFDKSACLSRRQLRDYINGQMANEECHAVEHHLNDCPLCSAAVDGMLVNTEKSLATVAELNTDFLKEHFGINDAEVQLNSMTPEAAAAPQLPKITRVKVNIQPFWRKVSMAAAIILACGLFWYMKYGQGDKQNTMIAQKLDNESTVPAPVIKDEPLAPASVPASTAPPENATAGNEQAAVPAQPETGSKPAEVKTPAAAAAATAKQKQDEKLAADMAEAKKVKADTKTAAAIAVAPVDKKVAAEKAKEDARDKLATAKALADKKAKTAPDPKKTDAKTMAANAKPVTANNKATAKEERQPAAQTVAAREEAVNRAAGAPTQGFAQASPTAAVHTESASPAASADKAADALPADRLDRGKYYFDKQNYNAALKEYRVEINNSSKPKRHQASYMAAQCYLKVGNTKEAERLLKIVIDEGGAEKRRAKKLLESINKAQPEK